MHLQHCDELSVSPFVSQMRELCQNERNFCPHSYTARKVDVSSFVTQRMFGGRRPILPEVLCQIDPLLQMAIFK